jgi:lipid-A-disaccharide synthase
VASKPTIFLTAAEASGDEHASHLVRALRERLGEARFVGAAGPKMQAAGCESIVDLTGQASMIAGPLLKLRYYRRMVRLLQRKIDEIRPDVVVPTDSPALNWHICAAARKCGVKVMYYVAPQVWAWAPWRVKKLARLTDAVACILPFEQDYLRARGVNATFVGHPLCDTLPDRPDPMPDLLGAWADGTWRVAMLPGSRSGEMARHAGMMVAVARRLRQRWPGATTVLCPPTEAAEAKLRSLVGEALDEEGIEVAVGRMREELARSHFALTVSGTATLEVAHFGVPMVVVYCVNRMMYKSLGRWLIRTPHFSLPNIVAGGPVVPELVPWFGNVDEVSRAVFENLDDLGELVETRKSLTNLVDSLYPPGGRSASANTAELVAGLIGR